MLIGINYVGTGVALKGCINDVAKIKNFLVTRWKFPEADIKVITDETAVKPTRAAIIEALQWLVQGAVAGDSLFFHYSGHGATQPDEVKRWFLFSK